MKLVWAILIIILADVLAYLQMYGPTIWKFDKKILSLIVLMGIPISFLYMAGTKYSVEYLGSQWSSRILFLLLGSLVFLLCAVVFSGETLSFKNGLLLLLTISILVAQVLWK